MSACVGVSFDLSTIEGRRAFEKYRLDYVQSFIQEEAELAAEFVRFMAQRKVYRRQRRAVF